MSGQPPTFLYAKNAIIGCRGPRSGFEPESPTCEAGGLNRLSYLGHVSPVFVEKILANSAARPLGA